MPPKTPHKKTAEASPSAEASPYASTFKNSRLPTHSHDVPEYVAFWSTRRLNLFMTLAVDVLILVQHYAFRRLLAVRYIPLQQSKYRGALEAVAVMGPPHFMDVCISIVKTLVAILINFAPEAVRSRIPGIFYLVVCRLINAADGAYLLMLQLYQVKLAEDYHDYPWFTGKTAPKQPARVPLIPSLAVAGSYMASGLILTRALLFCVGQVCAFFSKSVPAGRKTEMLISAEYAVKVLFFLNSLLSATPFLSSGWRMTASTAITLLMTSYHQWSHRCKLNESRVLFLIFNVETCLSRLPTVDTMTWFAKGLRKAADTLPKTPF